jgi:amphi-Trp domain-containing protein
MSDVNTNGGSPTVDDAVAEEYRVDASAAGAFLVDLGERLRADDEVVLSGEGWDLSFGYRDPVAVEIEYVGGSDAALTVELELQAGDGESPTLR